MDGNIVLQGYQKLQIVYSVVVHKSIWYLCSSGNDRGPVLEVIVSRTNFISSHTERGVRIVGLSTALANARDLADWLGIKTVSIIYFHSNLWNPRII